MNTQTMTFIIQHEFRIQEEPYYVRVVDNTTFEEVYDPQFATKFNTKKEAQQWIDVSSSMKEYSKIVDLVESVKNYAIWCNNGTVRRTLTCINRTTSRPYNNEPIDEVIDWWIYEKNNDDEIDYEDYKTWPHLYSMSKHLWDVEAYCSFDYDCEQRSITFQLYTRKSGKFEEFENELKRVINKVTHKDEDGFLVFPIFDHYLCVNGNSVSLLIHPETKQVKLSGRWSYDNREFTTLEDAFNYLKRERWYE